MKNRAPDKSSECGLHFSSLSLLSFNSDASSVSPSQHSNSDCNCWALALCCVFYARRKICLCCLCGSGFGG